MISPRLLKECVNSISSPLCTLFKTNHLVVVSCFPKLWKVANLVPVFKSDDKDIVDNYRGISLLSVVPKFWKSVFSHVFSLFFSLSFTIYCMVCKGMLVCFQSSYIHT